MATDLVLEKKLVTGVLISQHVFQSLYSFLMHFIVIQSGMLHSDSAVTFDFILPSSNMYTKKLSVTEDIFIVCLGNTFES